MPDATGLELIAQELRGEDTDPVLGTLFFRGHPDLRRILMPEDYEGYPQRRDFPVGGEPVLFTYNENEKLGSSQ